MNYYVVLDTNILVSALLSKTDDAATVQVIDRLIKGSLIPVYSDEIMLEYHEVLNRKKFRFDKELIDYLLAAVAKYGICITPASSGVILPDIKDLPFFEVVNGIKDEGAYLVTGNLKHFPVKPYIVTARQMIDIMAEKNITASKQEPASSK